MVPEASGPSGEVDGGVDLTLGDAGAPGEFSAEPKRKKLQYVRSTGFREEQKSQNVWIHAEGPELVVYSSECPHVGCNVTWKHEAGKDGIFFCPCHGGEFDLAGKVLAGPPPSDLKRLPSKVENGKLLVQV